MNYSDAIKFLKNRNIKPLYGDFYDFENFPLADTFEAFFHFGQTYLDNPKVAVEIRPSMLYFNTTVSVNAVARKKTEGINLIEIFKGAIFLLFQHFTEKEFVFDQPELKEYKDLVLKKEASVGIFLFRVITIFIVYHETGHIIQNSDETKSYEEALTGSLSADLVRERHIREHDADWFASSQTVFHLLDFVNEGNDNEKKYDPKRTEMILSLGLSAIYSYYIYQGDKRPEIYYAEKSHPHPAVRAVYMISYMLENAVGNLPFKLNQERILREAILLTEEMLKPSNPNITEIFSKNIYMYLDKIGEYINKIRKDTESYARAAINKLT